MGQMTDSISPDPQRCLIKLSGPDTLTLLERLVTNNTQDWNEGERRYGALLTPQGKVIADFEALRTAGGVDLNVAAVAAEDLAKRLKMFRLRADVQIDIGEEAPALYRDEARRIMAGRPIQGVDFGAAEIFPSDINMDRLGGVALNKGCFVGQEVVSRMHRRGNIRRRTVVLLGENLEVGGDVRAGGNSLGQVTSVDQKCALARLRIDRLARAEADGLALSVNDIPVTVEKSDWLQEEMASFLKDD